MSKNENNKTFLEYLSGVKPIKKTNKIVKKIPSIKNTSKEEKKIIKKTKHKNPKKITTINNLSPSREVNKKIKRGKIQIDKKIDLHGLSVDSAKQLFIQTVLSCYHNNKRCILFVTGKGARKPKEPDGKSKLFYGKIRSSFIEWASSNDVKTKILNVQQASPRFGGDGAFFVYLRKNKN